MTVTSTDGTSEEGAGTPRQPSMPSCRAREVLRRVGDKWSVYVIDRLGEGSQRFSELRRGIDGITARMLTVTLRGLERDGLISRTIHPVIPPRVDYELTPMGRTLLETIKQLIDWADSHVEEIDAAQAAYDAEHEPAEAACPAGEAEEASACGPAAEDDCDAADAARYGAAGATGAG
jgi:DNA-binding HxlR family transcriptional regulator